jgi:choline monooxygenase
MKTFAIDPDIRNASTPPAWVYNDVEVYRLAKERVFLPSWQLVGDLDRVRVPGQVYPFTLLDGVLDEPLLFVRDAKDTLRLISNVCTHRGALVCEHPGVETALRCRYHGRRFALDGRFVSMPEFEDTRSFPTETDSLRQVPFGAWGKLLFASLAPEAPLEAMLAPMIDRCHGFPVDDLVFDPTHSRDYLVRANWALYCENYLEGFHIPFVHSGLAGALDYGAYRTELYPHLNLQVGIASGADEVLDLPKSSPDYGQKIVAYYFWVWPNLMFNVYPFGISVNVVHPLAPDRCKVSFLHYVWDASRLDKGPSANLDRVEREDEAVVEAVQRGLRSRIYERGRYSPKRETGTHHFHRLLAAHLCGDVA